MHRHNGPSIDKYIRNKLHIAQDLAPNIESSIDSAMREFITKKADGVMIWARLVVDRLIEEAIRGASRDDLIKLLDSLPEDLERMYDQIFFRIPIQEMPQAALIMWFVAECGGSCLLENLYGFWHFLYMEISGQLPTQHIVNVEHFSSHVNRICGSFIEIRNVPERWGWQGLFRKKTSMELESQIGRTPVRLMHKTLQPYVSSSKLINAALPQDLTLRYSKSLEVVCAGMVTKTSMSPGFALAEFESDAWSGRLREPTRLIDNAEKRAKSSPRTTAQYELILRAYWRSHVPGWQRSFLAQSISTVEACLSRRKFHYTAPESYQIIKSALGSAVTYSLKLMPMKNEEDDPIKTLVRIRRPAPDEQTTLTYQTLFWECLTDARQNHCLDLIIAMAFGLGEYVDSTPFMTAMPSTTTCTWLVNHIMAMMAQEGRVTVNDWDTAGRVLELIWPHVSSVNLDLLFIVSQIMVSNRWYQRSNISRFALFSRIVSSLQHTSNQHRLSWKVMPHHAVSSSIRADDYMRQPSHVLHQWVKSMTHCDRALELASKQSLLSDILKALLNISLSVAGFGTVCEKCGGILRYLITYWPPDYSDSREMAKMRPFDHTWLQMTILLARLGATPGADEHLQSILKDLDQAEIDLNYNMPDFRDHLFLRPVLEIFEFYEEYRHWPDFEPYIKEHKLSCKAWQVLVQAGVGEKRPIFVEAGTQDQSKTVQNYTGIDEPEDLYD